MKIVVTGGAGFIGLHVVEHFLKAGHDVVVIDNLARLGSEMNLRWLESRNQSPAWMACDIAKDTSVLQQALWGADVVFHLAAQVAVTTSVKDPRSDFEANALGTFNVLESVRRICPKAFLIYSSTNKVYGDLTGIALTEAPKRYQFTDGRPGVSEEQLLDFYSPYGCSKGAADQYVRDYHRIYGIDTVVFRQSCIYGQNQYGNEDQGWLAWFTVAALLDKSISIYGNGKQVRDVLFASDLIAAYAAAIDRREQVAGEVFNIGGGPENTLSLLELLTRLERYFGRKIQVQFEKTRPGDQMIYVSDLTKTKRLLGWQPRVNIDEGLEKMWDWIRANEEHFRKSPSKKRMPAATPA